MADQETGQTTGEADPVSQPDSAADERRPRPAVSTDDTNTHTQDNEAVSTQKEDAQIDGFPGAGKMVKDREEKVSQSTDTLPAVKVEDRETEVSSTNDKQEGESTAAAYAPALSSSGHKLLRPSAFSPGSTATGMSGRMVSNPFTRKPAVLCGAGTEGSLLAPSKLAPNPFAAKAPHIHSVSSDSEDEKKDRPIVGPSHFHPGGAAVIGGGAIACEAITAGSPGRSILRPSALDKQTANFNKAKFDIVPSKTSFVLKPATLQSPLTNSSTNEQDSKENEAKTDAGVESSQVSNSRDTRQQDTVSANQMFCSGSEATKENYFSCKQTESESKEFIFGQGMDKRVSNEASCVSSTSCDAAAAAAPADGGFVFGQNLADRVTGGAAGGDDVSPVPGRPRTPPAIPAPPDVETSPHASLEESAAAYKARQARPEYQEVQVTTGEEDESNVFQILGKLFVFDKAQHSWSEKGRGLLRLNDMHGPEGRKPFQSRLVMRTQGSLRVILNTKVWSGMTVERASTKGVRITAMDGETLRVYLIMANPKDADQIFSAIDWRVQQLKVTEQENSQRLSTGEAEAAAARESCQSNGKRQHQPESPDSTDTIKKPRLETEQRRVLSEETSNDSSTVDPETEASSESLTSSPVVKSSPSTTSE